MSAELQTLAKKQCIPCKGGIPPLKGHELSELAERLGNGWLVVNEHHLEKEYTFPDYPASVAFANRVAAIAEEQNHHPDIFLTYGKVKVTIWTHKIDGLTESDFVFAAKVESAAQST
ncbi:MAG: 4a-hydroxytetrahydrobiopterin dehydratase [Candidatus Hydrogenedentes bacterium]|nr:4a-hydroxytetrahydrobiopterin dehydratase [Candidatus Hydrogenedentota bacterium]